MDTSSIGILIIIGAFAFGYLWRDGQSQELPPPTLKQLLTWRYIWWAGIAMTVGSVALSFVDGGIYSGLFFFPGLIIWIFSHWKLRRLLKRLPG